MSRKELPLPQEHIAPFDLEAFVNEAAKLNQRTRRPSPSPSRRPPTAGCRTTTSGRARSSSRLQGEVEGGLSWLIGATIDLQLHPRPLCPLLFQRRRPLLRSGQLLLPGGGQPGGWLPRLCPLLCRSAPAGEGPPLSRARRAARGHSGRGRSEPLPPPRGRGGHRGRPGRLCRPLPGLWPHHRRTPRHGWPAGALLLPVQGLCLLLSGLPAAPVG